MIDDRNGQRVPWQPRHSDMPQLLDAIAGRSRLRITSLAVVTLGLGLSRSPLR